MLIKNYQVNYIFEFLNLFLLDLSNSFTIVNMQVNKEVLDKLGLSVFPGISYNYCILILLTSMLLLDTIVYSRINCFLYQFFYLFSLLGDNRALMYSLVSLQKKAFQETKGLLPFSLKGACLQLVNPLMLLNPLLRSAANLWSTLMNQSVQISCDLFVFPHPGHNCR